MKATSRRRVLISSVAMLLVAMLALGTATFAWFTNQASANAKGIGVKTTKSSLLQVSKSDLAWSDSVNYAVGTNASGTVTTATRKGLKPVSTADGVNWYYGVANSKSTYTVKGTTGAFTKLTGYDSNYVFAEMLNIRNIGGSPCTNVKITVSATFSSQSGRIAIVPVAAQTTKDTVTTTLSGKDFADNDVDFAGNIYGNSATARTWSGVSGTSSTNVKSNMKTKAAANGAEISVMASMPAVTAATNGPATASYLVLVWFEGQDTDLYDTNSQTFEIGDITFTVTGSTTT